MAEKKFFDTKGGKVLLGATTGLAGLGIQSLAKKYKEANVGINEQIDALKNMELAPETKAAYQQAQMMANQGLSGASKELMNQQFMRGLSGMSAASRDRRSFLQSVPQMSQMTQDYALRMGQMEDETRRQNQLLGIQSGQQYGAQKLGLQQYKTAGLFDYWMGKKQALNKTVSGIVSGIARIGAAALTGGASEAAGVGSAISAAGQSAVGGQSAGAGFAATLPPYTGTYDFNQGATNIFTKPSLNYKPMGLPKK